jgi:uncharacterized phage-associated protein
VSSAKAVAKDLVRLSMRGPVPDPLTWFRLQSLLYYAQAWSLVLRNSELFPEEIECLPEGPVVPEIPDDPATVTGCRVVRAAAFDQEPALDDEDEAAFLLHLWAAYGGLSPSGLYSSIHSEAPFLKAEQEHERGGKGLLLMNELEEAFRRRYGMPAPLAAYQRMRIDREKQAELAILSSPPLDMAAIWKDCRSRTPSASKQ